MIQLVEPCERYLKSCIDAYDEYAAHGVTTYCFDDAHVYNIFEKYDNYRNERYFKPIRVGAEYYWLVDAVCSQETPSKHFTTKEGSRRHEKKSLDE